MQTTIFYTKKITLVQAQTNIFCVKSCKFEKFLVILSPKLHNGVQDGLDDAPDDNEKKDRNGPDYQVNIE